MKILICPDKFKECLSAGRVAFHIQQGILKAWPDPDCRLIPMADGGEGTVDALVKATNGRIEKIKVYDPLMREINSFLGISGDGKTAVIEMAAASGLALLKHEDRNPLATSTFGTGELIRHALENGCTEIILGIGGSATVDGGVGMAQALGIKFMDSEGREIGNGGGSLKNLTDIDVSGRHPRLGHVRITAACDVTNPLTGPKGAAAVYGPQKGATPVMVKTLDANLKILAGLIMKLCHTDVDNIPGAGAAGGMGAGIVAFLNGDLKPGFDLICQTVKLDDWIRWADLVITGEGKMDFQTAFGKTAGGVAKAARQLQKPVIAFTGFMGEGAERMYDLGFAAVIPIADRPMTLEESISNAGRLLENAAERVFRLMGLGREL